MTHPMADLERQFDGPIPAEARAEALAGGRLPLALRRVRGALRHWRPRIHDIGRCLQKATEPGRVARLRVQWNWARECRRDALRTLIRLQRQQRAERQNAQGMHADIIAPLMRTVKHSMGSLSVDAAVAAACRAPEPEDAA